MKPDHKALSLGQAGPPGWECCATSLSVHFHFHITFTSLSHHFQFTFTSLSAHFHFHFHTTFSSAMSMSMSSGDSLAKVEQLLPALRLPTSLETCPLSGFPGTAAGSGIPSGIPCCMVTGLVLPPCIVQPAPTTFPPGFSSIQYHCDIGICPCETSTDMGRRRTR